MKIHCPQLFPSTSFVQNVLLCHFLSPPDGHLFSIFKADIFVLHLLPPFPLLTDYTGSEENIDISVLGLHSKLNLPLKSPLSHNHKPEAYPSRPGYSYSEQIHVDGGYLLGGLSDSSLCVFLASSLHFFYSLWLQSTMRLILVPLEPPVAEQDHKCSPWLIECSAFLCCNGLLHHAINKKLIEALITEHIFSRTLIQNELSHPR